MKRKVAIPPNVKLARLRSSLEDIARCLEIAAADLAADIAVLARRDKVAAANLSRQISIIRSMANVARRAAADRGSEAAQ